EEHGGGFTQPENAGVARDVLEWHDENARRLNLGGRPLTRRFADAGSRRERRLKRQAARERQCDTAVQVHAASASAARPFSSATSSTHVASPVPRHATTWVRARILNK